MPPKRSSSKLPTATQLVAPARKKVNTTASKKLAATQSKSKSSKDAHPLVTVFFAAAFAHYASLSLARIQKPTSNSPARSSPSNKAASQPASSKRKRAPETGQERPLKRTKAVPAADIRQASQAPSSPPPLREASTQVLSVFAFGNGENSELGLGPNRTEVLTPCVNPYLDASNRSSSKHRAVQVACGGMHTVVLTSDNKIVTWGVNDIGALGRDTTWDGVYRDEDKGSGDEEEGELNPHECIPTAIPDASFRPGTRFVQVAAGDSCSFALTSHGLVYGWGTFRNGSGDNEFGYDAQGQFIEMQKTPTCIAGLTNIGSVWGWGAHEQNQLGRDLGSHRLRSRHQEHLKPSLVPVCRGRAKYIASGEYHSFAIDRKDDVWAWGLNSFGEAGYAKEAGGDSAALPYPMKIRDLCGKGVTVMAGGAHHSAAVTSDGKCLAWGRMDGGQLGIGFTAEQLNDKDLIRYDERDKPRICLRPTLVPSVDGTAYASGFGSSGQLGTGLEDDVEVARRVKRNNLKDTTVTWAGAGGQFSILAGTAKN